MEGRTPTPTVFYQSKDSRNSGESLRSVLSRNAYSFVTEPGSLPEINPQKAPTTREIESNNEGLLMSVTVIDSSENLPPSNR